MPKQKLAITGISLLALALLTGIIFATPSHASQPIQVMYATSTPLPDGRIIYIVEPGDSCLRIELLCGVPVKRIIELNPSVGESCTIYVGQELLIATISNNFVPIILREGTNGGKQLK